MEKEEFENLFRGISPEQEQVYNMLLHFFKTQVRDSMYLHKANVRYDYYAKYFHGFLLAQELKISAEKARKLLNELEIIGLVKSKRTRNNIMWAANYIEGYKQHKFEDYYEKIN